MKTLKKIALSLILSMAASPFRTDSWQGVTYGNTSRY